MRFLKRSPKKPEEISVREIRFLGEQDGPSEQVLKNKLVDLFHSEKSVTRAYLARFDLGSDESAGVILGLKTQRGPDKKVVEKVGAVFASIFNATQHLDIAFLTDGQEDRIAKVCKPFFESRSRA